MTSKTYQTIITPADADKYLLITHSNVCAKNIHVRSRSLENVRMFEMMLRSKTFYTTHQGIALDHEGNIIDGQHRLKAISNTGIPALLNVTVFTGSRDEIVAVAETFDRGRPRSLVDALNISGTNTKCGYVAATNLIALSAVATDGVYLKFKPTIEVHKKVMDLYGSQIVDYEKASRSPAGLRNSEIFAALALTSNISKAATDMLSDQLYGGTRLVNSPAFLLENFLRNRSKMARTRDLRLNVFNVVVRTVKMIHQSDGSSLKFLKTTNEGADWAWSLQPEFRTEIVNVVKPNK